MITGPQIRMAREGLEWSVRELAGRSGIAPMTVSRVENGAESLAGTLQKIQTALEDAGIVFLPENGGGPGVRLPKARRKSSKK